MLTTDTAGAGRDAGTSTVTADPDALLAAARVAVRQADHSDLMRDYVLRHLSGLDSFSGVLALFREQYAAALDSAVAGLAASAARAAGLAAAHAATREGFLAADESARRELRRLLGDLGEVGGTCAAGPREPGTGSVGAASAGAGDLLRAGVPSDPLSLPGVPDEVAGVRDQVTTLADEVEEAAGTAEDLVAFARFAESPR